MRPNSLHHAHEAPRPDLVTRRERVEITFDLDRVADVRPHDFEYQRIEITALRERHDGDVEPLLVDLPPVRAEAAPADVDDVGRGREQGHDASPPERRSHRREVVEVSGAEPGIVRYQDVAWLHGLERVLGEEAPHRRGHGVDVPGGAGHRLRKHPPGGIKGAGRDIAGLAGRRAEGGPDQSLGLFLDHGKQPVPLDLHPDAVKRGHVAHAHVS